MASRFQSSISLTGPLFTKDPAKTFRQNARSMMRGVSLEGKTDVVARLEEGNSGRSQIRQLGGHVSEHVAAGVPYTPGGISYSGGKILSHVYVPNFGYSKKQGQSLMAAYSRVESETHAFRRTTARLRNARAVNVAELIKGLN